MKREQVETTDKIMADVVRRYVAAFERAIRCGTVTDKLTLTEKRSLRDPFECVLNGLAYDDERQRVYVTGKCWPRLFQIEVDWEDSTADSPSQ